LTVLVISGNLLFQLHKGSTGAGVVRGRLCGNCIDSRELPVLRTCQLQRILLLR